MDAQPMKYMTPPLKQQPMSPNIHLKLKKKLKKNYKLNKALDVGLLFTGKTNYWLLQTEARLECRLD